MTAVQDQIDKLKESYRRTAEAIRGERELTAEAKRVRLARAFLDTNEKVTAVVAADKAAAVSRRRTLESRLFGISTLSGDAGSLAISRRDAGDRVAQLKSPDQALALLERAERTGDEPLARALVERAVESDWVDVGNRFLETRPHLDADLNELWHMPTGSRRTRTDLITAMNQTLNRPPELSGLSDYDMRRLVANGVSASA